ncbi:MAG TPA: heme biosynthesis protein HemY, partial [Marinobacter sp.]|nr:heme biosynthesis protein HemY [Marinobacter sp.]
LRRHRETLAELSRLNAHMGHEEDSIKLLMQGLETDNGLPDLPMPRA